MKIRSVIKNRGIKITPFVLHVFIFSAMACGCDSPEKLERRCGGGDLEACKSIGLIYIKGEGAGVDVTKAEEYLRKFCDGGYEEDCSVLKPVYIDVYNKHGYLLHSIYKDLNKHDNPLFYYSRALSSYTENGRIPLPPQKADYDDELKVWQVFKNKLESSNYTNQLLPSRKNLLSGINEVLDNLKRNSQVYVEGTDINKQKFLNKTDEINKMNIEAGWREYLEKSVISFCDSLKTLPPHIQSKINWDCSEMNNFKIPAFSKTGREISQVSAQALAEVQAPGASADMPAAVTKTAVKSESGIEWVFSKPAKIFFGRSEVTAEQYGKCVSAGACKTENHQDVSEDKECNLGNPDRLNHPMNCVDWNGADTFCKWAGGRLPAEKEWYAEASNNKNRKYPWGNTDATCEYVVMNDAHDGCGKNSTWSACSKPAGNSVSGLCDMSGNVWEWTSTEAGKKRVLRGGSWATFKDVYLRATSRLKNDTSFSGSHSGFRCAKTSR